jgi:hypothetical protein
MPRGAHGELWRALAPTEGTCTFCGSGIPTASRVAQPKALLAMIGEKLGHYRLTAKIGKFL